MRIAISGTHYSGKSTLIARLLKELRNYVLIEEPYYLLEEQGYEFFEPPSVEDFEKMIECSIESILKSRNNTLFDRSPFDYLAYAMALGEIDIESWAQKMEKAIQRLDLIVFVPIEKPERILVPASQDLKLRKRVDELLQEMLLEDSLGILGNTEIIEVAGQLEKRVEIIERGLDDR